MAVEPVGHVEMQSAQKEFMAGVRRRRHVVLRVDELVPLPVVGKEQEVVVGELQAGADVGPHVTAHDVASAVVRQVTSGYGGQLVVPPGMGWTSMIRGFPTWVQEGIRDTVTQGLLQAIEETS